MAEQGKARGTGATGGGAVATEQEIAAMTADQLRGWLTEHGVTGTSGMRKDELVKTAVKTIHSDQAGSAGAATGRSATAKKSTGAKKSATTSRSQAARPAKSISGTAQADEIRPGQSIPETGEDVIDVLLAHHDQAKLLFGEMGKARGEHRQASWEQLCRLLAIHESIEQQLVHPLTQQRMPDGEEVVQARLEEEELAARELTELWDMGIDDPRFAERFAVLRDDVTEHAELEEAEEFGWLRENVPPDRLIGMAALARAAEQLVPVRPRPDLPARSPGDVGAQSPMDIIVRVQAALREAVAEGNR
ncbi:hemerythrin domain-containing protein [Catellatospora sp. NPDC049609]|uniref:hemerythrin domain-containing protein n=1 Tax=Catellatospora sp. NPDC049609 TaxID=3155505 RepID=UPI0034243C70